jgi:hypothetical protein
MDYLECPECGEQCTSIPCGPDGLWTEGETGQCDCGLPLTVYIDGNEAFLSPMEDDEDDHER